MARSMIWQIDMGDGTWAACCMGCRLPLGGRCSVAGSSLIC